MLKKDEKYDITVTDMNNEGNGVCRIDNTVVFVIGAVTGDICTVKIIKVTNKYSVASIDRMISPSVFRCAPACPYKRCGGCVFQNVTPRYELEIKKRIVEGAFLRAGIALEVADVYSSSFSSYRNKAQFPVGYDKNGRLSFGYFAKKSHEIVFCERCDIAYPEFTDIARIVCDAASSLGLTAYDEQSGKGLLRHICLRSGKSGVVLTLVINSASLPYNDMLVKEIITRRPDVTGIFINVNRKNTNVIYGDEFINIYGDQALTDELCGLKFEISPSSFYQVNHDCCEAMYNKAAKLLDLKGGETVVDLYCGVGTVGLCAAKNAKKITGIEIIPEAVENAKRNAAANGVLNAEFFCGDSSIVRSVAGGKIDALIIDPPRKGLSDEVTGAILDLKPDKLLYISCDPNTLARDLQKLLPHYTADRAYPFNMFPRTGHVECVTLMTRNK